MLERLLNSFQGGTAKEGPLIILCTEAQARLAGASVLREEETEVASSLHLGQKYGRFFALNYYFFNNYQKCPETWWQCFVCSVFTFKHKH